jgi:hypothetical protein
MKTKLLIIIGILATLAITSFLLYNSIPMDDGSRDVDLSKEETLLELYKDTPEVVAFYAKYDDADVSIRDDHLSYFAGNEDDFRVRMNLYFDENYELDHLEFNCYVDRVPQTEVAETFILKYLEKFDCKKYGT